MVTLYGIKNCSTMKQAFDWLAARGIDYTFVDYKNTTVLAQRLPEWVKAAGVEALLNRRGLTWRKLPEAARAATSDEEKIALLRTHPTLIKRPVLEAGGYLLIGFDPDRYQALCAALKGARS